MATFGLLPGPSAAECARELGVVARTGVCLRAGGLSSVDWTCPRCGEVKEKTPQSDDSLHSVCDACNYNMSEAQLKQPCFSSGALYSSLSSGCRQGVCVLATSAWQAL